MKVLVVAEGAHEREGALPALVRRLNPAIVDAECEPANTTSVRAYRGTGDGFYKRALRWLIEAEKRGYDALVFVIDRDRRRERIREMNMAQHSLTQSQLPRALGVAIESFDAWILADQKALGIVLGCNVPQQKSPERMRDPKARCETLRDRSGKDLALRDMYREVLANAEVEVLEKRCPDGLAPFAERVERLNAQIRHQ